ncbi:MAG: T9SS type A sorting domain-containing protein [candidate division Zixibacteria bacterium]|nr:T9SS type A sorting domain-containing protein [candidate division Zixibacteria bacterium]
MTKGLKSLPSNQIYRCSLARIIPVLILFTVITIFGNSSASAQNLLDRPESVVYDIQNDRYLASNYDTGHIVQIDSAGDHDYFVQYQHCRNGLHIAGNTVYAACINQGVKGFDLTSGELVMHVNIEGMDNLNDIASDTSGNLYVTDVDASKIYRIDIDDQSYTTFVDCGSLPPNGICFDEVNNRLLVAAYAPWSPIQQVSLADSIISNIVYSGYQYLDGITQDNDGNVYFSTWQTYSIYRFDSEFSEAPEFVYYHPGGPADIFYNKQDDVLAVPAMNHDTVVFLSMPTSIAGSEDKALPSTIELMQNYPNPFNPSTKLTLKLAESSDISLVVYDIQGRIISRLMTGWQANGVYNIEFDGSGLPSGVYFARLTADDAHYTRKMIMLK